MTLSSNFPFEKCPCKVGGVNITSQLQAQTWRIRFPHV